jgi:hypothetical protein
MAALTNYLENRLLDWVFRGGSSYDSPSVLYFALFTTPPTDAGGGVECSGGGYARAEVEASSSSFSGTQGPGTTDPSYGTSGTIYNNVHITFPSPTAGWGTVTAMGVFDAATGGNLLVYGPLTPSKVVNANDAPPRFASGQWVFQLDTDVG